MKLAIYLMLCYCAVTLAMPDRLTFGSAIAERETSVNCNVDSSGSYSHSTGQVQQAGRHKRSTKVDCDVACMSYMESSALESALNSAMMPISEFFGMNNTATAMYVHDFCNIAGVKLLWSWFVALLRDTGVSMKQFKPWFNVTAKLFVYLYGITLNLRVNAIGYGAYLTNKFCQKLLDVFHQFFIF
ncbi:uncharacterized protein LOC116430112 isoform X1 [Nomia melanderi]|uniref:uncharacterized protein LOC116430112 isoform X1 n=1 Tax=Nomia melanderi TaxID=2448451 RepID=UPI00130431FC|nr:uncharacterized protein LOC116430112 isoform X1 [Nomia melanderi]